MQLDVGKIIDIGREEAGGLEHLYILEKLWGKDGILSIQNEAEYESVNRVNGEIETFLLPVSKPKDWAIHSYCGAILNKPMHEIFTKCFVTRSI